MELSTLNSARSGTRAIAFLFCGLSQVWSAGEKKNGVHDRSGASEYKCGQDLHCCSPVHNHGQVSVNSSGASGKSGMSGILWKLLMMSKMFSMPPGATFCKRYLGYQ